VRHEDPALGEPRDAGVFKVGIEPARLKVRRTLLWGGVSFCESLEVPGVGGFVMCGAKGKTKKRGSQNPICRGVLKGGGWRDRHGAGRGEERKGGEEGGKVFVGEGFLVKWGTRAVAVVFRGGGVRGGKEQLEDRILLKISLKRKKKEKKYYTPIAKLPEEWSFD